MSRADVWVLGNLTIDDVVLADGTTAMGLCGGNAIFAAIGARFWSTTVGLAARVGPDFPRRNLHDLESAGIRLALSPVAAPTLHNWALYESADQRRFVPWLDSGTHLAQSLLPAEVPRDAGAARVCHVAPMPFEVQARLVRWLSSQSAMVSLDPHDEYIRGHEDALLDLLDGVDLFMPSRQEAALLYGRDEPESAALAFARRARRVQVVVIKLGDAGSIVCATGAAPLHVPAVPVRAVDPTGAGDAYCGAFAASYARCPDAGPAAMRATVAASFVVEARGALATLPIDPERAEQRLAALASTLELSQPEADRPCVWTNAS